MASIKIMNWLSESVRSKVMAMGVPPYAAKWGLEIANEIQADNVKFDQPGCGHLFITFESKSVQATVIVDPNAPETFTPEAQQTHIRVMTDAAKGQQSQIRAAAAAQPERGAKPN